MMKGQTIQNDYLQVLLQSAAINVARAGAWCLLL